MTKTDEIISKSLDDIDKMVESISKEGEQLSKSLEDPKPGEVSNEVSDTPEEGTEESAPEEGVAPEEEGAEEGEGAPEEENPEIDTDETNGVQKSLSDELNKNEEVRKALEVSDFLSELVGTLSSVIGEHTNSINKSIQGGQESQQLLAKSFVGIVKSQKAVLDTQSNIIKSVNGLVDRLERLEAQPTMRKSVNSANTHIIDKNFSKSLGGTTENDKLSKSEAISKLNVAFEGGDYSLGDDIIRLESTGNLDMLSSKAKSVLYDK